MLETPHDPIPKSERELLRNLVHEDVERENLPTLHVITDLPAQTAVGLDAAVPAAGTGAC